MKNKIFLALAALVVVSVITFLSLKNVNIKTNSPLEYGKYSESENEAKEKIKAKYREEGKRPSKLTEQEKNLHNQTVEKFMQKHGSLRNVLAPTKEMKMMGLSANWIEAGPNGATSQYPGSFGRTINGRIIEIEQDFHKRNIFYAGTPGGGLWRSINFGKSFKPMTDAMIGSSVAAIVSNPHVLGEVWMGTGAPYNSINGGEYSPGGYLYKSSNYGVKWKQIFFAPGSSPANIKINEIVIPRFSPNFIAVATQLGLFLSVDSGKTFTFSQVIGNAPVSSIADVSELSFGGQSHLCLQVGLHGQSITKRMKWNNTLTPSTIIPSSTTNITFPLCINPARVVLSASRTGAHTSVYASVANTSNNFAGVWMSTDGGLVWRKKTLPNQAAQMNYNNAISVHNWNPNYVYLTGGTNTNIYYSFDSCNTWIGNPAGMHADQHTFTSCWNNNDSIYCGHDGGLSILSDYGATLSQYSRIRNIEAFNIAVNPSNPFDRYIGTQDNGVLHTFTGLKGDWEHVAGGDGWDAAHGNTIDLISGFPGPYLFSWNHANTTYVNSVPYFMTGLGGIGDLVYLKYNDKDFYAGRGNAVFRSNGSSLPWVQVGTNLPGEISGMDVLPTGRVAAGLLPTSGNFPVRVTDNSGNFAGPTVGPSATLSWWGNNICWDLRFGIPNNTTGKNRVYGTLSAFTGKRVVMSEDGGESYTDITGNLPDNIVDANVIVPDLNDPNILYIAGDLGVFATIDGGITWFNFSENLPVTAFTHDMEITKINGIPYLMLATAGRGVWYTRALDLGNKQTQSGTAPKNDVLFKINPNPVRDYMTISIDDAEAEIVNVKVYSLTGALQMNQKVSIDGYNGSLNCSTLKSGTYFIEINYGNRRLLQKFIKLAL